MKRYIPPPPLPKYEDKVFIKGVSSSTTKDSLFNFLEAKSNAEPIDIIYGEEEGTALVTFDTKPGEFIPVILKKKNMIFSLLGVISNLFIYIYI